MHVCAASRFGTGWVNYMSSEWFELTAAVKADPDNLPTIEQIVRALAPLGFTLFDSIELLRMYA